jgi:hypothetical protein
MKMLLVGHAVRARDVLERKIGQQALTKHDAYLVDARLAKTTMPSMHIVCFCRGTAGDMKVRQPVAGLV